MWQCNTVLQEEKGLSVFFVDLLPPPLELSILCCTKMNEAKGVVGSVQKGGKQEGRGPWGWAWAAMSR